MKDVDGVVVKVTKKQIVLLCKNGTFKNLPRSKHQFPLIGEKMAYSRKTRLFQPKGWMALASITCLLFLMFTVVPVKNAEAAYIVAFDINPSIEVYVDENLKVMSMMTLNSDGGQIISKIDYKGKDLSHIVNLIINQCVNQHYLTTDGNGLVSTTIISTLDEKKLTPTQVESIILSSLKQHAVQADVSVTVGSKQLVKNAHEMNLSVNKYVLYKSFKEKGIPVSIETVQSTPINQLWKKEKNKNNQSAKQPSNNKNQSNNNQNKNNQNKNNQNKDNQSQVQGKKNQIKNKPNQNNKGQSNQGQNNNNKVK